MKIGFDAKRLFNNFTGLGNYSRTLVHNLQTYYPQDEYYLYTTKVKKFPEVEMFLDPPFHAKMNTSGCSAYWRSFSIKKDLKRDNIDLYHGLSHEIPVGIHKTGIKSVVTIHDIIYKTYPYMFSAIDRRIYDIKFRYSCKHADRIIAISESTKNDIIRYFGTDPDKIDVIYQAINPIFYTPQEEEKCRQTLHAYGIPEDFLLYVGAINSRKNLAGIVSAYALLPSDLQIPFVIIGNGGKYKQEVIRLAEKNNILQKLIFIDKMHDSRSLQAFYQMARIFIFPSFYEGFGLPVTEALLSGTPVITSDISSLPEAGGDAAHYVDPSNIEELCEGIKRILGDSELRKIMTEKGVIYAKQQFDPKLLTEQTNRLYREVILR